MKQLIKTKIDGVPVILEIVKMGPADAPQINNLEKNIAAESEDYIVAPPQQVRVVKIGEDDKPATPSEVAKVKDKIEKTDDPAILIQNIANSIQTTPSGKDFWTSKVFWINIIALLGSIAAYFGFDFKAHDINPEAVATFVTTILAVVNLYYRKGTDRPLNPIGPSIKRLVVK
jgi:hypothetical protein